MDPLDTVGQDAHPMAVGNKVVKTDDEKTDDESTEMDEIADTMPTEGPSIEESELLEVDEVETSDEEDDVPSNQRANRYFHFCESHLCTKYFL